MAKFLNTIDRSLAAESEGEERMKRVRPIIHLVGKLDGRPHLGKPHALDSIGSLLNPSNPESYRRAIMESPTSAQTVKVWLVKPLYELLTTEQADALPALMRAQCVAVRGSSHVARRLASDERYQAKVRIEFEDRASVVIRRPQPVDSPLDIEIECTEVGNGTVKVLRGVLEESARNVVTRLFEDRWQLAPSEMQLPLRPKAVTTTMRGFWELPVWLGEHFCTVFQDLYRMTALIKAACPADVTRPLQADAVRLFRQHDATRDRPPLRVLVRGTLHATSQLCVCAAHLPERLQRGKGAPRRVDFEMEFCGLPLDANGVCPVHRVAPRVVSSVGVRVCTHNLKARVACRHQDGQTLCLDLPADVWADGDYQAILKMKRRGVSVGPPVDEVRNLPKAASMLQSLMAVATSMCLPGGGEVSILEARERREQCEAVMQQLDRDSVLRGLSERDLVRSDLAAARLLRSKCVRLDRTRPRSEADTPIKSLRSAADGFKLAESERALVESHGHLFPRHRV
tara:strand:+ start:14474 stop:16012 length:1539 start_codon:yes stop_codon:yes gene_type:complete